MSWMMPAPTKRSCQCRGAADHDHEHDLSRGLYGVDGGRNEPFGVSEHGACETSDGGADHEGRQLDRERPDAKNRHPPFVVAQGPQRVSERSFRQASDQQDDDDQRCQQKPVEAVRVGEIKPQDGWLWIPCSPSSPCVRLRQLTARFQSTWPTARLAIKK